MIDVAVIIVSWNVRNYLADCLRSVAADLRASRLRGEIWVVDNASTDGTVSLLGVELVTDRDTRTPATAAADHIVDQLRLRGVLASTDGPDDNVLKIKPPMVFGPDEAAILLAETEVALSTLPN